MQRVYILQRVGVSREVTAAVNLHLAGAAARHGAVSEFVKLGVQVNKNQSFAQIKYPQQINLPAVVAADATAVPRRDTVLLACLHRNVTHTHTHTHTHIHLATLKAAKTTERTCTTHCCSSTTYSTISGVTRLKHSVCNLTHPAVFSLAVAAAYLLDYAVRSPNQSTCGDKDAVT